jgi:hypothetical protein
VDHWETSNVDVEGDRVVGYEKPAQVGRHRYLDYGFPCLSRGGVRGCSGQRRS